MSANILVVDDDPEICALLTEFFGRHEHQVTTAHDGRGMFDVLDRQPVDLIILDIMMPGEDGLSLCRRLRSSSQTPVIMLTAIGEDTDRIVGLEIGADDYLVKPFNPRELLARVRAVLRRRSQTPPPEQQQTPRSVVGFSGWSLDLKRRELRSSDQTLVPLSAGEFDLLVAFIDHPHHVLTRDQLLDLTRGRAAAPFDRSIDVQVSRLRRKIEVDPQDPLLIKTVRSGGYMFTPSLQRQ